MNNNARKQKIKINTMIISEEVARGAIFYAKLMKADYIFCGHTHMPMRRQSGKINYYNSGCWLEAPSSYIAINKEDVELIIEE